jgi:translation initiation factor IF-3
MDLNKFLYREEKKLKESKKGARKGDVKDVQLSLFIGPADFERFIQRGKEFLDEGNQLRINILLRGREMGKRDLGIRRAYDYIKALGELNVSKEPKLEGRVIRAVVSRKK